MLIKNLIDSPENDTHLWYDLYSDTEGKMVLQQETGDIYGCVTMRDDDPHTYVECDDPDYDPNAVEDYNPEDEENEEVAPG